jgi:hypothetical protein
MGLCELKVQYSAVPLLALLTIPLAYLSVNLTGAGHATIGGYLPFLLLYGPLSILVQTFNPDRIPGFLLLFATPYAPYLLYGFIFAFLSGRTVKQCRIFLALIFILHCISGVVFLYHGGFFE